MCGDVAGVSEGGMGTIDVVILSEAKNLSVSPSPPLSGREILHYTTLRSE